MNELFTPAADAAFTLNDDSMTPAFLCGDTVFIRLTQNVADGDYIVYKDGDSTLLRRYHRQNGVISLTAANELYSPVMAAEDDLVLDTVGVVTGYYRPIKGAVQ